MESKYAPNFEECKLILKFCTTTHFTSVFVRIQNSSQPCWQLVIFPSYVPMRWNIVIISENQYVNKTKIYEYYISPQTRRGFVQPILSYAKSRLKSAQHKFYGYYPELDDWYDMWMYFTNEIHRSLKSQSSFSWLHHYWKRLIISGFRLLLLRIIVLCSLFCT